MFTQQDEISANDLARLRYSQPMGGSQAARKTRRYRLSAEYRRLIGGITAVEGDALYQLVQTSK